jgi:hypothetical protein
MDYLTCHFEGKANSEEDGTIFGYGSVPDKRRRTPSLNRFTRKQCR